jgi:hypothetical protein
MFIAELIEAIRKTGYAGEIEHDETTASLVLDEGARIGIDGLFTGLAHIPPERREDILVRSVKAHIDMPPMPASWEEARDRVLPLAYESFTRWSDQMRSTAAGQKYVLPVAQITEHLGFRLGFVLDTYSLSVPPVTLSSWNVEPDVAFAQATLNLQARSNLQWKESREFPGAYLSHWPDGQAASRLCLPQIFTNVPIRGQPVAMVPTPQTLVVTGSDDEEGLFNLARVGRRKMEGNKLVHLLRTMRLGEDGETWTDWMPAPEHPVYNELRYLRTIQEKLEYDNQARVLAEVTPEGELMPLPPLEVQLSRFGAMVRTVTRWRDGPRQGLPKADVVVLLRAGQVLGAGIWDQLAAALPWEFEALPGYPTRYLVGEVPEPWQLSGLDLQPWQEP